jgi:hypothetical protein
MKRTKRYDEGGGIPAQTEEEAANEMELNSPAARARRNVSDAENQIRADAVAKLASKAAPAMKMDEAPTKMPMRPGQASSGSKTPMVTKEQLAASGLSLRDYLNKQQGLTRRGESTRMPAMSNKLGQPGGSISDAGSGRDVAAKQSDKADLTSPMSALRSLTRGKRREDDDRPVNERIRSAMGMAKGGSVGSASKRADGIAVRGKTKGKMC